jgi:hypothetical protein
LLQEFPNKQIQHQMPFMTKIYLKLVISKEVPGELVALAFL